MGISVPRGWGTQNCLPLRYHPGGRDCCQERTRAMVTPLDHLAILSDPCLAAGFGDGRHSPLASVL